ncbi:MAG: hypothetical protein NC318_10170 [Blautia sp.]|nr:hypothetical protein [Lachnoclostridium sp.]MCM1211957.1 hypothetical protein [Blautia sp.]
MKSLIRFEDTYGMTDIFCAIHELKYMDIDNTAMMMNEIMPGLFVDFGLGSRWGIISDAEAYAIMERGIEKESRSWLTVSIQTRCSYVSWHIC